MSVNTSLRGFPGLIAALKLLKEQKEAKQEEERRIKEAEEIAKNGPDYEWLLRLPQKKLKILDSWLAEEGFRVAANTINSEANAFQDFAETQTVLMQQLSETLTQKL
jgi:hypothetical protein